MSARSAVALQQGADEQLLAAVDHYADSELSPNQQAALLLADAYLTSPADLTDEARQELAAHLTTLQIVELVVQLMVNSSDKTMVALGLDLDEVRVFTMG
jgi:alkylhydroperoxidase family enzyme